MTEFQFKTLESIERMGYSGARTVAARRAAVNRMRDELKWIALEVSKWVLTPAGAEALRDEWNRRARA